MSNNLEIPENINVRALAVLLKVQSTDVISKLIKNGVMAHINQTLDYDTAAIIASEFGFEVSEQEKSAKPVWSTESKEATSRPPIVSVMGHVDHGKTSLLDYIRSSNVAAGESGGITQHIRAYQIDFKTKENKKRKITFIDTPGHEAFTALRQHGANITDIVILVVAADDGVKPQTIETIEFAKKVGVPIVVAINKCDLPTANVESVKRQLAEHELIPEDWGGKTTMIAISTKTGKGIDELLEMVTLTTDLLELKADPTVSPEGIVVEGKMDPKIGVSSVILVYNGTLKPGQVLLAGKTFGRIRSMTNDQGTEISSAGPATPVIVYGLKEVPEFGESITTVPNEKIAKDVIAQNTNTTGVVSVSGENTYKVIIKTDVGGSLAALGDSIKKLKHRDAIVEVVSSGIGDLNENDINMANASKAIIIAFRVTVPARLIKMMEHLQISYKQSFVIYEILEFLSAKLEEIATPLVVTEEIGKLKILEVFSKKDKKYIVGGDVIKGVAKKQIEATIQRAGEEIGQAKVEDVKVGKISADLVEEGKQCGVSLVSETEIEKGDILIFIETTHLK